MFMLVAYTVSPIEPALGAIERGGRTGFQNLEDGVIGDEGETNCFSFIFLHFLL